MKIEIAHFEAVSEEQKELKARFTKNASIIADGKDERTAVEAVMTATQKAVVEASKTTTQDTTSSVKSETTELSVTIPILADKEAAAGKPTESVIVDSPIATGA